MINKIAVITTLVILVCISLLLFLTLHFYGKSISQANAMTTLTQQKNEAEFITQSQSLSVGIFNQIAGVTLNDQKTNHGASERRQSIIKTVLEQAPCAVVPVPASANNSLLEHYNQINQSTANAHPGKPAG